MIELGEVPITSNTRSSPWPSMTVAPVLTPDDNAAGWEWFVDRTPGSDSEYWLRGNQGEKGRADALTVIMHELGHLFGIDHDDDGDGVMNETLWPGVRR